MGEVVDTMVVGRPALVLRPYVERYVGYRRAGLAPGTHPGLPSRHLTFIVSFDQPLTISAMPDASTSPGTFDALVGGLHAAPATIAHDGNQHGVQLELTPVGARALLGMPAAALAWTVVHLGEVFGPAAAELFDRLSASATWADRFAVLDEVLARRAGQVEPEACLPQPVAQAWDRLRATDGRIGVGALAHELGWSRRHLGQRFRAELGLSPKVAARVFRFERARRLLVDPAQPGLAEVALTGGFYDQSHLTREWREMAGCTPTAWLAEDRPSVQDLTIVVGRE